MIMDLLVIFNAKTSHRRYFCSPDDFFFEVMEINSDEDILKYFFDHCNLIENNILHIDTLNVHVDRMFLVTSSLKCARKIIYILLIQELVLTSILEKLLVKMQVLWTTYLYHQICLKILLHFILRILILYFQMYIVS